MNENIYEERFIYFKKSIKQCRSLVAVDSVSVANIKSTYGQMTSATVDGPSYVAQDTFVFTQWEECGHMRPRPPPLDTFTPLLCADHLWLDHSRQVLIPGLNGVSLSPSPFTSLFLSLYSMVHTDAVWVTSSPVITSPSSSWSVVLTSPKHQHGL